MNNRMTNYDHSEEDKKTLQVMAKNFDNWYDWDPTEKQSLNFEKNRINKINQNYIDTFANRELEDKTWELVSTDLEIQNTLEDIKKLHENQFRKIDDIPFVNHPISVAKIISRVSNDNNLIRAWLLHDVIEDVKNGRELMQSYPIEILNLVDSVTEQDKSLSWQERKKEYLNHLKEYQYQNIILSLSDRIQNLRDMIEWLEKYWDSLREKFNAWPKEQKWFILNYSMKIKEAIDNIKDEKNRWKLLDLYNELTALIWYFIHIIDTHHNLPNTNE